MLQEKNREIEWLRAQKEVDDVSFCFPILCDDRAYLVHLERARGKAEETGWKDISS